MTRRISGHEVFPVGFGCMNMSGGYTPRVSDEACDALLNRALDLGVTLMDTAAVYGAGHSETMIGQYVSRRRAEYTLCTKWGFSAGGTTGKRGIDNDPRRVAGCCEESLRNLKTDVIDLWYLHRWDKETPIEEVIGEMGRMVEQGKVRTLGLSEVSAQTLRKAHAEHPIAAVQSEYSLWTRNPEIAVRDACEELGAAFVAFSPLARQFLTDVMEPAPVFTEGDIRIGMPRFEGEDYAANRRLLDDYRAIAARANCTPGQLALAWVLAQGEHVIPIPGTQKIAHLEENTEAAQVEIDPEIVAELDDLINQQRVRGGRYPDRLQAQIDTEEFEAGAGEA